MKSQVNQENLGMETVSIHVTLNLADMAVAMVAAAAMAVVAMVVDTVAAGVATKRIFKFPGGHFRVPSFFLLVVSVLCFHHRICSPVLCLFLKI
jgi:hypothetical protein